MISWKDIYVREERNRDLKAEAERYRLRQRTKSCDFTGRPWYGRLLVRLGQRLVIWGWRLQLRNEDLTYGRFGTRLSD